ncbi:uncharacterized protein LOC120349701 [Nilaparvata lugens]|uniref:uncharacterized protein LOC120349701 n=1 Tax=Nilaparvata lugens TaxID=108931 RepID=UPI00193CB698|nr:uncharacterized protein LOC120349701 [Nilaparvata lugens]
MGEIDFSTTDPDWALPESSDSDDKSSDNGDNIETEIQREEERQVENEIEDPADDDIPIKKPCRWQKADPSTWARNKTKDRRNLGDSYKVKGKLFPEKRPVQIDCSQCMYKCTVNFTEDDRLAICSSY